MAIGQGAINKPWNLSHKVGSFNMSRMKYTIDLDNKDDQKSIETSYSAMPTPILLCLQSNTFCFENLDGSMIYITNSNKFLKNLDESDVQLCTL